MEIDADLMKLTSEMKHVLSLISPSKTYMVIFEFKLITILFCDAFGVLSFLIIFYTFRFGGVVVGWPRHVPR